MSFLKELNNKDWIEIAGFSALPLFLSDEQNKLRNTLITFGVVTGVKYFTKKKSEPELINQDNTETNDSDIPTESTNPPPPAQNQQNNNQSQTSNDDEALMWI